MTTQSIYDFLLNFNGNDGPICKRFQVTALWNMLDLDFDPSRSRLATLGHSQAPPPLGPCLCDVIIHIPKGLICSFLWPIFSSCFARISPTVCPNFIHCLPEFGGAAAPPAPPASYAYGPANLSKPVVNTKWYNLTALTLTPTILSLPPYGSKGYRSAQHYNLNSL